LSLGGLRPRRYPPQLGLAIIRYYLRSSAAKQALGVKSKNTFHHPQIYTDFRRLNTKSNLLFVLG
jgi:hypothetical protein